MFRKIACILLAALVALLCCACNMRGNTQILDTYSAKQIYATYKAVADGSLQISVNRTETIPTLRTAIVDNTSLSAYRASLYFYNESSYYVSIHGYAWVAKQTDDANDAHKAIYFNSEKEVANSSYEIRIDPGRNTYLQYELADGCNHTPDVDSIYFIFFQHEETEYVGAVTADDLVFWPLEQTLK